MVQPRTCPPHILPQLHRELTELQRRQETLEAAGPAFHAQLQAARDQLRDVHVSDAMYAELSRIPEDDRLLADAVRLTVYEALRDLRAENERLRRASEGDREAAARAEEERERHRRAAAAAEARAAERTREAAREVDTLSARLEVGEGVAGYGAVGGVAWVAS